jgi:hypothetical protein
MRHAVLIFLFIAACGGKVVDPGPGGSSSSSSSSGGNDQNDRDFPICPADPPLVGGGCPANGQGCRYLTRGGACDAYACEDGKWRAAPEGC